ncbi:hypothetical protein LCGC14_2693360 [marine sediment metagenome]|uniref:Uncharacterized protein n=1 Tax=marine sediment metagenome TaxID=412755 RepID=A0A0F8ZI02_9ZZZZ
MTLDNEEQRAMLLQTLTQGVRIQGNLAEVTATAEKMNGLKEAIEQAEVEEKPSEDV